jgi:mono/diheme cytochrome c family protein
MMHLSLYPHQYLAAVGMFLVICGCDMRDMYDQPRAESLESSRVFPDGMSARPQVEGTIARGYLREDVLFFTGQAEGQPTPSIPDNAFAKLYQRDHARLGLPVEMPDESELRRFALRRGQERFDIYCAACHGRLGQGDGMIVQRGFRRPPSYHLERLRVAPAGHFYDVISHGFGSMPAFANRIEPADRWAIVAYIRALQLSQNAPADELTNADRAVLEQSAKAASTEATP